MNIFRQRPGEICLNKDLKWVLNGVEIPHFSHLEILIGGHWIDGIVVDHKEHFFWASTKECVIVDIRLGLKARLPIKK